mmetsp:Transcript_4254/g.11294  ORF Transcript_4254/g.11294 Transcript_4254/m.11294 type:complete len:660 (-) Transcript_4254:207-2186(-)
MNSDNDTNNDCLHNDSANRAVLSPPAELGDPTSDCTRPATWLRLLEEMHEKRYFKHRVTYKKFSIGMQLLPVIKGLYPDASFDVPPEGMKLSGSVPWWQAAKSAIMEHFKIEKLHEDKKGGGHCIQDWDLDWDLINAAPSQASSSSQGGALVPQQYDEEDNIVLHHRSKRRKGVVVITPEWTPTNAPPTNTTLTYLGAMNDADASSKYDNACLLDEVVALIIALVSSSETPASDTAVQQAQSPGAIERMKEPCSICTVTLLSELSNDTLTTTMPCKHRFCLDCIMACVKRKRGCPLCRQTIVEIRNGEITHKVADLFPEAVAQDAERESNPNDFVLMGDYTTYLPRSDFDACTSCGLIDDENGTLSTIMCDGILPDGNSCNRSYCWDCVEIDEDSVPEGDWIGPCCQSPPSDESEDELPVRRPRQRRRVVVSSPESSSSSSSHSDVLVPPPSDPPPPSLPNSPPGSESVDGDVEPPLLTLDQPTAQATICTALKLDCSVCKRRERVLVESRMHSMQWQEDLLAKVWELVRGGMWQTRLKARIWKDVHDEMIDTWEAWQKYHTTNVDGPAHLRDRPQHRFHNRFCAYKRLFEKASVYVVVNNDEDWEFQGPDIDYAGEYLPALTFGADADEIIRLGPVDDMGRSAWYAFEPRWWGGICHT